MSRGWANVHEKVERVRIGFPEKDFTAYLLRKGVLFILYVRTKSIITLLIFKTKMVRIQSFKCWHYYARAIQGKLEPLHFIVFIYFALFLSWLEWSEKENSNRKIQKIHLIFKKKGRWCMKIILEFYQCIHQNWPKIMILKWNSRVMHVLAYGCSHGLLSAAWY